ncbi:MAG: ATP-dependent 6-phosphofructokinase [Chromatiales bacterium]|jgi:6-phosphofructokinase 1
MPEQPSFEVSNLGPCNHTSPLTDQGNVRFVDESERLLCDPHIRRGDDPCDPDSVTSFELAGPRRDIYFEPGQVRAAIVTCGGLCPGLNAVIRGIVMQLWYIYGCHEILGVRFGYGGLGPEADEPIPLRPDGIAEIHNIGGSILGSSRGTPGTDVIVDNLQRLGVNVLFVIGGDGSMRGAEAIWAETHSRGLEMSVVGVPKTIDNDIPYVRRSFGFETAVEEAAKCIDAAEVEAKGVPYGIGLVKLMGRHAGFIAATAALASGNANFCLIPEVEFTLEGETGLFALIEQRLRSRRHAVIVVAEGAGQELCVTDDTGQDASGNVQLGDIGLFLKDRLNAHFGGVELPVTLKYIDPSYLVRSAPPNPTDQIYCDRLARNAVHAAMAGKTGMLVGYWHGRLTHVPVSALQGQSRKVAPTGDLWNAVLENTGQPHVIGSPSCPVDS